MEQPPTSDGLEPDVTHLARFNADQLRSIERAIAEHLEVDTTHVTLDGFSVTRESDSAMGIQWRGAALIDMTTFHRIVREATADDESAEHRWRETLPQPNGPLARPRQYVRRKRRRDAATPEADRS
jgi:hypothetical protein